MTHNSTLSPAAACQLCQSAMPDLLLDPESPLALAARPHLLQCEPCRLELSALEGTSGLLSSWAAPEPSTWFDQRLYARLREAQAAPPESFFERLRSRLLFSSGRELRPLLAGGLALLLAIGGGTAALTVHTSQPAAVQASATVQDLQILDRNDQAIQTMDQLLDDTPNDDSSSSGGSS